MPIPIAIPAASWIAGLLGLGSAATLSKSSTKDLKGFMEYLIKGNNVPQKEVEYVRTSPAVAANIGASSILEMSRRKKKKKKVAQQKDIAPEPASSPNPKPEPKEPKKGILERVGEKLQKMGQKKTRSESNKPKFKINKNVKRVGAVAGTLWALPEARWLGESSLDYVTNRWNYNKNNLQIGDRFIPATFITDPNTGIQYGIPTGTSSDTITAYRISPKQGKGGSRLIMEGQTRKVIKTNDPVYPYKFYQEPTIVDSFSAPAPVIPKEFNKPKVEQPPTIEEQLDDRDRIYNVRAMKSFIPIRFRNG